MSAAAHAVHRLIESRHPASVDEKVLAILHKLSTWREPRLDRGEETQFSFTTIVPAWSKLNRALFWYEAAKAVAERKKARRGMP